MKGSYHIRVRNRFLIYDFTVKRNITIIQGNSATGKTTLVDMIRDYENLGEDSAVSVISEVPLTVVEGRNWARALENTENSIVFIDEGNRFTASEEFASHVKNSTNYFVIVAREALYNLPYSVEEIYGIRSSGKYGSLQPVYHEMYHIYPDSELYKNKLNEIRLIITEDSNSGYQFFSAICSENIKCVSAGENSNVFDLILKYQSENILVIADGAAFGPFMNKNAKLFYRVSNLYFYLPESFEWLILKSGMIDGPRVAEILETPSEFVLSERYFSWERFFTSLLTEESKETFLQYKKSVLNPVYLHKHERSEIMKQLPDPIHRLFSAETEQE